MNEIAIECFGGPYDGQTVVYGANLVGAEGVILEDKVDPKRRHVYLYGIRHPSGLIRADYAGEST